MPRVPAICQQCHKVFPTLIDVQAPDATFKNCIHSCIYCGGPGRILDGVYSALENTLHVVFDQPDSVLVKRLIAVLENAQIRQVSTDQVRAEITNTAPELRALADCLPHNRNELYKVITIILALLALVLTQLQRKEKPSTQEIHQYIDNSINNSTKVTYEIHTQK